MKAVLALAFFSFQALAATGEMTTTLSAGVDDAATKRQLIEVDYMYGKINYQEPEFMSEYGSLHGVAGRFTVLSPTDIKWMFEGELMMGSIRYDGHTQGGAAVDETSKDRWFGFKALAAFPLHESATSSLQPIVGLAYRDLNDHIRGKGGYEREISYIYLPMGIDAAWHAGRRWSLAFRVEADLLLSGLVKSHLEDVDTRAPTVENRQELGTGWGMRYEVSSIHRFSTWALHITPYLQQWRVKDSEAETLSVSDGESTERLSVHEPANSTLLVGVKAGVIF